MSIDGEMEGRREMGDFRYLFIAGASRSGTTLLMNVLDGHPQMLVFPLEHKVLHRYFTTPIEAREEYFRERFIKERSEGQQSVLASAALYEAYRARIKREFGTEFQLDVDNERFLNRYQEILQVGRVTLESVFDALTHALISANPHASARSSDVKYVVFKDPFTTEFFARQAAELMPSAKFLHIVRDPYARYCSEKMRRLRKGRVIRRPVVRRINYQDFVTGLAEKAIASLHSGLENQRLLGPSRYLIIRFEDLVQSPRPTLNKIADWIGVEFDEAQLSPSKLGEQIASGSSFRPTHEIDANSAERTRTHFYGLTSASERDVYHRYLALSDYRHFYDLMDPAEDEQRLLAWARVFKGERIRDYLWRLATGKARIGHGGEKLSWSLRNRLPHIYTHGLVD